VEERDMNFPRPMSQWPLGVKLSQTPTECSCRFNGGPLHAPLDEPVLSEVNDKCVAHGKDAERWREKIALYGIRYGTPPERMAEVLASMPQIRETRRERVIRWVRSVLHLY
jgi:hypothetical protein